MTDTVTISLVQGGLRGRKLTTKAGVTYYSFQGIPYAKPPVGPLRFKPPEPAEPWEGIKDALKEGSVCAQHDTIMDKGYIGEEDSLFLNVYTTKLPKNASDELKPVMVWVHGGGFTMGSSNSEMYGPDYLIAADVVLVTINYRLGPLGFLSTGDSEIPGNNGLKDQIMALRWVQLNIAHFGGDSGNVTVFGESAGGGSVHLLMLSPMSKGLFHRVIAQSGSALNPWAYNDPATARKKAFKVGEALGCKTESAKELAEFLRSLPVRELVEGVEKAMTDEEKHPFPLYFAPTKESGNGEAFLPENPSKIIEDGKFQQVPLMTGYTSEEGIFVLKDVFDNPEWFESLNEKFDLFTNRLLYIKDQMKGKEIGGKIKKFYFGDKPISKDSILEYAQLFSDLWFIVGIHKAAQKQLLSSESPIFLYRFAYEGKLAFSHIFMKEKPVPGASHGDELGYLFHMAHHPTLNLDPEEECMKVSDKIVKLWANFAKTGNPTPDGDELGAVWEPVTQHDIHYLNIDKNLKIQKDLPEKRLAFWRELCSQYNILSH